MNQILVTCDTSDVANVASERIVTALRAAIQRRGMARLAIPGGSAVRPVRDVRNALGPHWSKIKLTWVDERCVDFDDADSSRGAAYRDGALSKSMPCEFELPGWLDGETPAQACQRIQQGLIEHFNGGLDVALLGMGPDGHIASLFPGRNLRLSSSELVTHISDSPKPPNQRITLTMKCLLNTEVNILVALGDSKRDALSRLLDGDDALPASHLKNLTIITNLDLETTS